MGASGRWESKMAKTPEEVDHFRRKVDEMAGEVGAEERIKAIAGMTNIAAYLGRAKTLVDQRGWGRRQWSRGLLGPCHEAGKVKSSHRGFSIPGAVVAAIYDAEDADPNGAMKLAMDVLTHTLLQASIRMEGVNALLGTPEQRWARAVEICEQPAGSLSAIGRWNDESCQSKAEAVLLLHSGKQRAETWMETLRRHAS